MNDGGSIVGTSFTKVKGNLITPFDTPTATLWKNGTINDLKHRPLGTRYTDLQVHRNGGIKVVAPLLRPLHRLTQVDNAWSLHD